MLIICYFFFQAEDGIRDLVRSRGLGDVYKRQLEFVPAILIMVIKFVPGVIVTYYKLWKVCCECMCKEKICLAGCGLCFVVANALVAPVVGLLLALGAMIAFFALFGLAFWETYKKRSPVAGLETSWGVVQELDRATNRYIFDIEESCLPNCPCSWSPDDDDEPNYVHDDVEAQSVVVSPTVPLQRTMTAPGELPVAEGEHEDMAIVQAFPGLQRIQTYLLGEVRVDRVWSNMFAQCGAVGVEALAKGLLQREDVQASRPAVVQGLPSVVILRSLQRSLDFGASGILLADGLEVTEENRPKHMIGNLFWEPSIELKAALLAAELSVEEFLSLERHLLAPNGVHLQGQRDCLTDIATRVTRMATNAARLPAFKERIDEVVKHILEGKAVVPAPEAAPAAKKVEDIPPV
eukprot:TRINITY_DN17375_c0_g1_i1.p1 TRINITY_DN17375_c0_g1~~TRINITY_DN17375_c0_g1_i1.p1  ORF type:complete len:407 (+),score=88.99 TRINITY_DN17375_c0_g1_i1:9-1229(+)